MRIKHIWSLLGHVSLFQWIVSAMFAGAPIVIGYLENLPLTYSYGIAVLVFVALTILWVVLGRYRTESGNSVDPVDLAYRTEQARQKAIDDADNKRQFRTSFPELTGGLTRVFEKGQKDREADEEAEREIRKQKKIRDAAAEPPIIPGAKKAILDSYEGEAISFPYRKAVLQVKELKATKQARAGEEGLVKIGCHIDIENQTGKPLKECRVKLISINGDTLNTDNFLRIGGLRGEDTETLFTTYHHSIKRINFMKRDLEDVVSNLPFLLCLNDRDFPLSDGKEYQFIFALQSEYKHPTYVTVRCYIPDREEIEISVENQSLDLPNEQA